MKEKRIVFIKTGLWVFVGDYEEHIPGGDVHLSGARNIVHWTGGIGRIARGDYSRAEFSYCGDIEIKQEEISFTIKCVME